MISAASHNGNVTIHIPRTFHGPVTATSKTGQVQFSAPIKEQLTIFSEVKGSHKCFIGDPRLYLKKEGKNWEADELVVESKNSTVKIQFDDEPGGIVPAKVKGFLAKLFSGDL